MVASHRHFGRAAEALHITQPSLSRQIRHFEQQMGARLIDRTPQGSQLTDAGEFFLPRAKALLRSAADARPRPGQPPSPAGSPSGTPPVSSSPPRFANCATAIRTPMCAPCIWPGVARRARRCSVSGWTHRPTAREVLYDESRVLVVPIGHRLAGKEFVTLDDIADEPLPRMPQGDPVFASPRMPTSPVPALPTRRASRPHYPGHDRQAGVCFQHLAARRLAARAPPTTSRRPGCRWPSFRPGCAAGSWSARNSGGGSPPPSPPSAARSRRRRPHRKLSARAIR
jgi:DNA-binding transcriptional LysR family regulator